MRWFAPNRFCGLLVPELRRRGLTIGLEGNEPARLALAMSGTRAEEAWRYARRRGCPLVLYIWDLPPQATSTGSYDPVWAIGGVLVRLPRPLGGFVRRPGYYSRLRYIAARADQVWVPSRMTGDLVGARFKVDTQRLPYCYDSERFLPADRSGHQPPTLLTVSRLKLHKNQAATITAAAKIGSGVRVRLIGRGPEHAALERLARSLRVPCEIDTSASDGDVVRAYRSAAVAVCPSRFEGFGLAPIEAIATGIPVVASDIPPHREFAAGAARFFSLDDEHDLETAVIAALEQPATDPDTVRFLSIPAAADRFLAQITPLLQR